MSRDEKKIVISSKHININSPTIFSSSALTRLDVSRNLLSRLYAVFGLDVANTTDQRLERAEAGK